MVTVQYKERATENYIEVITKSVNTEIYYSHHHIKIHRGGGDFKDFFLTSMEFSEETIKYQDRGTGL